MSARLYFTLVHGVAFRDRTKRTVVVGMSLTREEANGVAESYRATGHIAEVAIDGRDAWFGVAGIVTAQTLIRSKIAELEKLAEDAPDRVDAERYAYAAREFELHLERITAMSRARPSGKRAPVRKKRRVPA